MSTPSTIHTLSQRPDPAKLVLTRQAEVKGQIRHYYTGPHPARILWVSRGRRIDEWPQGQPLEVLIGWDQGTPGFVPADGEGIAHTKITILGTAMDALSAGRMSGINIALHPLDRVIADAPQADRAGGYRGTQGRRALAEDEPTQRATITAPASTWAQLEALGSGNRSAGVRQAALLATATAAEVEEALAALRERIQAVGGSWGEGETALLYDVARSLGLSQAAAHRAAGEDGG